MFRQDVAPGNIAKAAKILRTLSSIPSLSVRTFAATSRVQTVGMTGKAVSVLVVGGSFAGLSSANTLQQASENMTVTVVSTKGIVHLIRNSVVL